MTCDMLYAKVHQTNKQTTNINQKVDPNLPEEISQTVGLKYKHKI